MLDSAPLHTAIPAARSRGMGLSPLLFPGPFSNIWGHLGTEISAVLGPHLQLSPRVGSVGNSKDKLIIDEFLLIIGEFFTRYR